MRRLLLALAASTALIAPASAQVGMPWPGPGNTHTAGAAYTGFGDTVSANIKAHWGVIAWSSASRGNKMLYLCNFANTTCSDVNSDATTGLVSSTQVIGGDTCGTTAGVDVCTVRGLYDDSGVLVCTGSTACDLVSNNVSPTGRPTFLPNAVGTLPAVKCVAADLSAAGNITFPTIAIPFSSVASVSVGNFAGYQNYLSAGTTFVNWVELTTGKAFIYNGSNNFAGASLTANTPTGIINTFNGTSGSNIYVNAGTPDTATNVGTGSISGTIKLCQNDFGTFFDGLILEVAIYGSELTSGNVTSLNTVQHANGGF